MTEEYQNNNNPIHDSFLPLFEQYLLCNFFFLGALYNFKRKKNVHATYGRLIYKRQKERKNEKSQ